VIRRRSFLPLLVSPLVAFVGCAESKKKSRSGAQGAKRPKGPQTMGNLMVDAWKQDLADKSPDKRIRAARELGNMGSSAKSALPALQKAAGDKNKDVAAAAKAAIAAIGKK
jgi:hypothetical protein